MEGVLDKLFTKVIDRANYVVVLSALAIGCNFTEQPSIFKQSYSEESVKMVEEGNSRSESFSAASGVRQGGVLCRLLFTLRLC